MLVTIIILAFTAGFYQSSLETMQRKNRKLEQKIIQLEEQLPMETYYE